MKLYRVTWVIDLEADSPEEAARKALEIQRDPDSTATVFEVQEHHQDRFGRPVSAAKSRSTSTERNNHEG